MWVEGHGAYGGERMEREGESHKAARLLGAYGGTTGHFSLQDSANCYFPPYSIQYAFPTLQSLYGDKMHRAGKRGEDGLSIDSNDRDCFKWLQQQRAVKEVLALGLAADLAESRRSIDSLQAGSAPVWPPPSTPPPKLSSRGVFWGGPSALTVCWFMRPPGSP